MIQVNSESLIPVSSKSTFNEPLTFEKAIGTSIANFSDKSIQLTQQHSVKNMAVQVSRRSLTQKHNVSIQASISHNSSRDRRIKAHELIIKQQEASIAALSSI
jgi:hypothetical protein